MPFILIKNYLKLMLRNKWILLMMTILPVIVVALLSNAFRSMLDTVHQVEEFRVGYRISEDNIGHDLLPQLKSVCEENGVLLQEYPQEDISLLMQGKTIAAFVEITDHSYTIYQSSDGKIEASIVENIFSSFFYDINSKMTEMTYVMKQGGVGVKEADSVQAVSEKLDTDPVPPSDDYYGIVFSVYSVWWGMLVLVSVISSERKGAVLKRMRVSHMSKFSQYIGRFIPGFLAIFIEVCLGLLLSVLLLDIHWGNIGTSIFIIFLASMASAAFGIFLFQLFGSAAVSIVVGFTLTWIMGFFGGSFQSYMYNMLPQRLVNISPIYYINRTLVEFSTKGHSAYLTTCMIYLLAIILAFGIFDTLLMGRKLEEQ